MKKTLIYITCVLALSSCDPDVPGEGINLPEIELNLNLHPDTSHMKLGDTLRIFSSISKTLSNGVEIEDGKAMIDMFFGYCTETPVNTLNFEASLNNEHFKVVDVTKGGINISSTTNKVTEIFAIPYEDNIELEITIVPLKTGTYIFQSQPLFYEGSKGKARTTPKFNVANPNWDLWSTPGIPIPEITNVSYYRSYLFAVYE